MQFAKYFKITKFNTLSQHLYCGLCYQFIAHYFANRRCPAGIVAEVFGDWDRQRRQQVEDEHKKGQPIAEENSDLFVKMVEMLNSDD